MASTVNNLVHVNIGQRGVACVAPLCHFIPYLVFSFHPPYPVLVRFLFSCTTICELLIHQLRYLDFYISRLEVLLLNGLHN